MKGTSTGAVVALAVLVVTGVTFGAAPAAAQSDDPALGDVFSGDDMTRTEQAKAIWSGISASADRAGYWLTQNAPGPVRNLAGSTAPDPTAKADAVTGYYNSNNASIERWTSSRTNVSDNRTIEVAWHIGDETATRYVLVNASNGSISSSRMVASTNRTVGETVDLCGYAVEKSPSELERFVTDYAEPGEDVDASYLGRMKGAYGDDVETTLINSGGDCPRGDE
jgi:hypothetical protein